MTKLNQIIAVEKGVKSRAYSDMDVIQKAVKKPELFNGFSKIYEKRTEDGEDLPGEKKVVQFNVRDVLKTIDRKTSELLEVVARKDFTNQNAIADIKMDDQIVLPKVPVTYLLFLEKQLVDLRTLFDNLPVLDPSETWKHDSHSGLYKSDVISTHRTKKVQRPIVLYDATDKHPAQTQLVIEDVLAGYWKQEKHSGAIPLPEKQALIERVDKLLIAVKQAREAANNIDEASSPDVGKAIFEFLFKKGE